jgi:DNA-binding SARP family transcriptional activator
VRSRVVRGAQTIGTLRTRARVRGLSLPDSFLSRPALDQRLNEGARRRLTAVVAGAGYGKTTLLAAWGERRHCAWYSATRDDESVWTLARGMAAALDVQVLELDATGVLGDPLATETLDPDQPATLAALLCSALDDHLGHDVVLVIDDVHVVGCDTPAADFLADFCRQTPPRVHLVLASRSELPFPIGRLRAQGEVVDITSADLAFEGDEVSALLAAALDDDAVGAAARVHEATRGWPAAVRLATEALRNAPPEDREQVLSGLARVEGPLLEWLTEEVLGREAPGVTELLRVVAPFERFTAALADEVGASCAADLVPSLERRGLLLSSHGSEPGWYAMHPLLRGFARERLSPDDETGTLRRAADWFEEHNELRDALRCRCLARDWAGVARLVHDDGVDLVASGAAGEVAAAADALPEDERSDDIVLCQADAHFVRGDWQQALTCLGGLMTPAGPIPAAVAWRAGLVHHFQGHLREALSTYERGDHDDASLVDRALLLARESSVRLQTADDDRARSLADAALAAATATGDDRALATAHLAVAAIEKAWDFPAGTGHLTLGSTHAERARDVVQLIHAHLLRGAWHLVRYENPEALVEFDQVVRLADTTGIATFRGLGAALRGNTLLRMGRIEEARRDVQAARARASHEGEMTVAYPVTMLGELYRIDGDNALATATFEEAVRIAEATGDVEGLVPALSGLAALLAASDPDRAERLVQQATSYGPVVALPQALVAGGFVALAAGDSLRATARADEAGRLALARGDRSTLGTVLELRAAVAADLPTRRAHLAEAHGIWAAVRDPLRQARAELGLARLAHAAGDLDDARELAAGAAAQLHGLGARRQASRAEQLLRALEDVAAPPVEVATLGRFAVVIDGHQVGARGWQSRKARDLLKVVVARRGRPLHRETIIELLWPDDDADRASSRLSGELSTLRRVLDPQKRYEPDEFVASDGVSVRVHLDRVRVDVEAFLADAEAGLAHTKAGHIVDARPRLVAAEAAYVGDFLEDEPFADWAVPLREEARSTYVAVARALADDAAASGDHDLAVRCLLRILERDPYDEPAHLALTSAFAAARRHGEARRAYRSYCTRMHELGVEPAVFPAPRA